MLPLGTPVIGIVTHLVCMCMYTCAWAMCTCMCRVHVLCAMCTHQQVARQLGSTHPEQARVLDRLLAMHHQCGALGWTCACVTVCV